MSRASAFIERMGETALLYNRTLTIGARDAVTGWPPEVWDTPPEEIKIFVDEILTREDDSMRGGRITLKRMKAFVQRSAFVGYRDLIVYHGEAFYVESVTTVEYLYGAAQFDRIILVREVS